MTVRKKHYFKSKRYLPCRLCTKFCVKEYLCCFICAQYFHRDCVKMTKKSYENISKNKQKFICSSRCYNAEMPFFPITDEIEFLYCIFGVGNYPCTKCKRECLYTRAHKIPSI